MPHTPLSEFANVFPGQPFYVVGRGPSLWNWAKDKAIFWNHPTIFINSSIHFLGEYKPGLYEKYPEYIFRIMMDLNAVDHYLNADYYKHLADRRIPNVHTFVSFHMIDAFKGEHKAKINSIDFTCYYIPKKQIVPLHDLPTGNLWAPTLFSAISLAAYMGASEIILAGVDYGCSGPLTHWDIKASEAGSPGAELVNGWGERMQNTLIRRAMPLINAADIRLRQFAGPRREIPVGEKP